MGFIHPDHGRISIETRGDHSFIIHAGYGFSIGTAKLKDLEPGTVFLATDPREPNPTDGTKKEPLVWRLRAIYEDKVEAAEEQFSTIAVFPLERTVEVPGTQDFESA